MYIIFIRQPESVTGNFCRMGVTHTTLEALLGPYKQPQRPLRPPKLGGVRG